MEGMLTRMLGLLQGQSSMLGGGQQVRIGTVDEGEMYEQGEGIRHW
jgi:hypothetical protein